MTAPDPLSLTVSQAATALRQRLFSPSQLEAACRERLAQTEAKIHAYLRETPELSVAPSLDAAFAARSALPALAGIPVAIKDNLTVAGVETTAASKILAGYRPTRDATVVAKLRAVQATIMGKTNLDEFGMGASTENSAYGPTKNPLDLTRVPGGSSGGSAAAVAAGSALYALGTDTGGSVRHPAAFCGLVGLKPTYGRVSRFGLIALTSSTDVVGMLTKTAADAAIVLRALAGSDPLDATSPPLPVPEYPAALAQPLAGLRAGVPHEYLAEGIEPGVREAVERAIETLRMMGVTVESCSLPATHLALWSYYIITPAEASTNLSRYDGIRYGAAGLTDPASPMSERFAATRGQGFGPEPKRRILLGTFALSAGYYDAYYDKAQRVRTFIRDTFSEALQRFDFLVTPTTPTTAFALGAKPDPLAMYLSDVFLTGPSLAGLPALSVPCGLLAGLPVGLQLIGRPFAEATILRVAHQYESARGPLPVRPVV